MVTQTDTYVVRTCIETFELGGRDVVRDEPAALADQMMVMQGELFGQERLIESALRVKSRTSAEIIKSIYSDVIAFSGGTPQDDDVTAVVVKRKG